MANPRKIMMALLGVPKSIGGREAGVCDKCNRNRAVAWVHELEGFRCSHCLADVQSLGMGDVSQDITEEDEEYKVSEAWTTLIENAGKMGPPSPPRTVGEE
jgi:hypothetical protein